MSARAERPPRSGPAPSGQAAAADGATLGRSPRDGVASGVDAAQVAAPAADAASDACAGGPPPLYLVLTYVPRRSVITVGQRGPQDFPRGWYVYVGSAVRARGARVARHLAAEKQRRWHADHLFAAAPARVAWLVDGAGSECELAGALAGLPGAERRPPRFGAGDCRCAGHLVYFPRLPRRRDLAAAAHAAGAAPGAAGVRRFTAPR